MSCECGKIIVDQTDSLPWKAHLIPDQDWFGVFDEIDRILSEAVAKDITVDDAQMAVRRVHLEASRRMYQCGSCGRLFVADRQGCMNVYVPASDADGKRILEGRGHPAR